MWGLELSFDKPWYLLLLAAAPALWLFSYKTLAGLGTVRRLAAIALRTIVFLLLVVALAEIQLLRTSGKLTVDFSRNEVLLQGQPVKLTSTERKLLYHLIRNEGRILSHETLLSKVWGDNYNDARDLLRVHIQHLRQKLGDNTESPNIIVTEHGIGYKFVRPAGS